jgi:hypothetical protein
MVVPTTAINIKEQFGNDLGDLSNWSFPAILNGINDGQTTDSNNNNNNNNNVLYLCNQLIEIMWKNPNAERNFRTETKYSKAP